MFEEEFEDVFDELFELEFDELFELELELVFEELLELVFELEFDEPFELVLELVLELVFEDVLDEPRKRRTCASCHPPAALTAPTVASIAICAASARRSSIGLASAPIAPATAITAAVVVNLTIFDIRNSLVWFDRRWTIRVPHHSDNVRTDHLFRSSPNFVCRPPCHQR